MDSILHAFFTCYSGFNRYSPSLCYSRNNIILPENEYNTFLDQTIDYAPHTGSIFHADSASVYQHLISLIAGGPTEIWLRASDSKKGNNGKKAVEALRKHYAGSGYSSRMIGEATKLEESLHYKSERSLPFATFAMKLQHMFNLYWDNDTELSNDAKLREKPTHHRLSTV